MDIKFDKLSTRIETINRKTQTAETLTKQNQNSIRLKAMSTEITLVVRVTKKKNQEKTWNNTSHVLSISFCGLSGWNQNQFLSEIERAHSDDYKNPNSPIYLKFISQKVSQAVLDSIIRTNGSGQTNIFASQKYSDKVQKRMNRLLITRREFKNDEEKSSWKSYVEHPGMLMVKKPEDQNCGVYLAATDQVYIFSFLLTINC